MTSVLSPSPLPSKSSPSPSPSPLHPTPLKEGWLAKVGGSVKTWKSRYFRLYSTELLYFDSDASPTPKGAIPIRGGRLAVYACDLHPDHPHSFALTPPSSARHYLIAASSHAERMAWVGALRPLARVAEQAQTGSLKEGWLTKQGGRVKTWKKRWVIVTEQAMVYYKDVKEVRAQGGGEGGIDALDLGGGFEVEAERGGAGGKEAEWVFTVKPQMGSGRVYKFACQTEGEREGWVKVLKQVKQRHDSQQMNIKF